jgi:Rrf2 family protein
MKITAQEEYGLRCLMRLAHAWGKEPLTIPEIAATENLSVPYVGKLLNVLRQAGLVESVRGRSGGYHLARRPGDIRLGAVLLALGEPLFEDPGYCEKHAGPETSGPCVHQDGCSLKSVWHALERWLRHILDQLTLEDLLQTHGGDILGRLRERLRVDVPEDPVPLLQLAPLSRA